MKGVSLSYSYDLSQRAGLPADRNNIVALQAELEKQPDNLTPEEAEAEYVTHYFAPGTYTRRMFIPEGMCVVGKIHRHAHLNVLLRGSCKVVTEFGDEVFSAPRVWVSEPGTKRAVFALEDLEWLTVHQNTENTRDTDALERYIISPDYDTFDRLQLESGDTQ